MSYGNTKSEFASDRLAMSYHEKEKLKNISLEPHLSKKLNALFFQSDNYFLAKLRVNKIFHFLFY